MTLDYRARVGIRHRLVLFFKHLLKHRGPNLNRRCTRWPVCWLHLYNVMQSKTAAPSCFVLEQAVIIPFLVINLPYGLLGAESGSSAVYLGCSV